MKRDRLLRLKAALLVAVMMSGGERMPFLDIVLFHAGTPTHTAGPHFDAQGAPHSHGELCRLSSVFAYSPKVAALPVGLPVVPECQIAVIAPRASALPAADFAFLPQTRAPPILAA